MKLEDKIGIYLRTINNLMRRHIDNSPVNKQLACMTGTNAWLIAYIQERTDLGEEVFQKDIEGEFCVTRSTVSKVIKLMEQKGMVRRVPVERDARLKKLVLTGKAQEIARELKEEADAVERRLLTGFTPEEEKQLSAYLKRLLKNIESFQCRTSCKKESEQQ